MYKPSLKSTWTLLGLAAVSYGLYNWAEYSRVTVRQPDYEEKIEAARVMQQAMDLLKEAQAPEAAYVDEVNDPYRTLLIGQKHTLITSVEGSHNAKLSSLNPNMAAMVVQMFREAGLRSGQKVAVAVSGSFPGINLAVYSACKVLDLDPVVLASVSSSWYGANDPDFTWLDMERVLSEGGLFTFRSVSASIGGADDRGRSLPPEGRALIRQSIQRNGVGYLNPSSVESSVQARIELYMNEIRDTPGGYGAYVNVGGGVASLGHVENGVLIPLGVIRHLRDMNYPARGVIHFYSDNGVPVINFKYRNKKFESLLRKYGLPWRPAEVPEIGEGRIFDTERYDLRVVALAVVLMAAIVFVVIRFDLRLQQLQSTGMEPEDIL